MQSDNHGAGIFVRSLSMCKSSSIMSLPMLPTTVCTLTQKPSGMSSWLIWLVLSLLGLCK
jgi:hypothetical protein